MKKYLKHYKKILSINLFLILILTFMLVILVILPQRNGIVGKAEKERGNTSCLTQERVFDYADKLTDQEEEKLRALIAKREKQVACDIVLVTLADYDGDMMEYADDFYDNNMFGYDKPYGDGAVYVDNWSTGEVWFSTSGSVEWRYNSSMIDFLITKVCAKVNANPYEAYEAYVNTIYRDMMGLGFDFWGEYKMVVFIGAAFLTLIYLCLYRVDRPGRKTVAAEAYVKENQLNFRVKEDVFVNKYVRSRRIQTSSSGGRSGGGGGGGHHRSRGGHSHGGGGGRH